MYWPAQANEALRLVFFYSLKIVVYFTLLLTDILFSSSVTIQRNIASKKSTGCDYGTNSCSSNRWSLGQPSIIITCYILGLPLLSIFMSTLLLNMYDKLCSLKFSLLNLSIKLYLWMSPLINLYVGS